jgi:hypothetical protein
MPAGRRRNAFLIALNVMTQDKLPSSSQTGARFAWRCAYHDSMWRESWFRWIVYRYIIRFATLGLIQRKPESSMRAAAKFSRKS